MRFLDTNIFIRYLTNDDPQKAQACLSLMLDLAKDTVQVWTSDVAVFEVVYVLSAPKVKNGYGYSRSEVRDLVLPLIRLPGIQLATKVLYPRIFELYTTLPLDFADAYHVALVEQSPQPELYSYDNHFDRVPGVTRLEP